MQYIGIDMSKDSFHAAFDEQTVKVFLNNPSGIKQFLHHLVAPGVIGVEATGVYHLLFTRTCARAGFQVKVINPLLAHRMITSTLRQVKTDRTDTLETLALKILVQQRQTLVRMRTETKQRIQVHTIRAIGLKLKNPYSSVMRALSREIQALEQQMQSFQPETQELLRSIPGIGKIAAASLVAYVSDIQRFEGPEQLVAYLGLDPRIHQSGTSINGKGFITKRGNAYLRCVLFNAAFVARRKNLELKAYFDKKISEGKHYFNALCAVERKLVHLIYAVWSRGTPYEDRT